ncbi:hypothetical protein R1sor_020145 [Riccia sorocarpa]|uniref:Uncharacterized protein n=1 Tax=Riccia sorocarpa TaxID=122646 RepID=A0ABD3IEL2_9MARC
MMRSVNAKLNTRVAHAKPYHVVRDRKGRRVILCAVGDCDIVGNCRDFIRLRGTLAARWRISRRRKFKRLLEKAFEFKENRSALTGKSTDDNTEIQVRKSYRLWKCHQKEAILQRLSSNLKATLMRQYNLTNKEAIIQGGLHEELLDSSDDEY